MTIDLDTALVGCASIAAITLVLASGDRRWSAIAVVICAIEALVAFRIIQLSSTKFRIDVILSAVLAVTGGVCWVRSTTKRAITAATVIALVGSIQLVLALRLLR